MDSPVKIIYYPAPAKFYSEDDLREIFSRYSETDPLAMALKQIFQVRFADAAVEAAALNLTERQAGHAGGRIAEISAFREEILGYMNAGEKPAKPEKKR